MDSSRSQDKRSRSARGAWIPQQPARGRSAQSAGELEKVWEGNCQGYGELHWLTQVKCNLSFQLAYVGYVIQRVADHAIVKGLLALLASLFDVKPQLLLGLVIIMFLDGVTGVWHSKKLGKKISQTLLVAFVTKAVVYTIGVTVSIVVSNAGIEFLSLVDDIIIGAILFTELVSVLAHLSFIHEGWRRINNTVKVLLKNGQVPSLEIAAESFDEIQLEVSPKAPVKDAPPGGGDGSDRTNVGSDTADSS